MQKLPTLMIITGFPATGKTTLAKKLSEHFSLPLVCVDELKEMMFDRIGNWEDMELFDSVSKASYDLMYYTIGLMLSIGRSCIIEAFLRAEMAEPRIAKLKEQYNCRILLFQFNCDANKLIERYENRHNSNKRHPCHPENIPKDEFIMREGKSQPINIDGETVIIDTTDYKKIDWSNIFNKVKEFVT
jgi:predicted kinase